ncbi:MAG TPA: TIM barrel protein [Clostridiales bacterium]|nr:TIM barrel protein [Clostridiales bacterium]
MSAKFGPAGNSDSFYELGYKGSLDVPDYIFKMGLDAYEYQCGRGVNIGLEKCLALGEKAREKGVTLTLHAPYYISLSSVDPAKRDNSIVYILQSARAVDAMGGDRVVVHSGSCGKLDRKTALEYACDTMKKALEVLDDEGLSHIRLCPETMGKINQLGTLDEVLTLCELDERMIPCIDFGHLNARTHGGLSTYEAFEAIFDEIENRLGISRLREYHGHFSKIEYSDGGEKKHLTFEDTVFGPVFEPFLELTVKKNCSPVIICESDGTQAEDALKLKKSYEAIKEGLDV